MKKLILLLVVVVMNVTFVSAKEVNPVDDYPKAVKTITKLLGTLSINEEFEKSESVRFTAMVNNDNELIVLQMGTKNETFKNHLTQKLNYQKIEKGAMVPGKLYSFIVTFKPE
jgi:predicted transcriptional regulator